jgi:hypothetical protein
MHWRPHPGAQARFHASDAFEVLYGGAAGGGKSEALFMEGLRYVHIPGYRAIYFRRSYPELEGQGSGIIARAHEVLDGIGGRYDAQKHLWHFPSGATYAFAHLEHDHTVHNYRSAQFAYLAFDELTTFSEQQYVYMLSRCRTTAGVPARVRAGSNPGGVGHAWVRQRFIERLKPYEVRWFKRLGDDDVECEASDRSALSRQFIPALVYDNPTLMAADPGYIARLEALDAVDRARLLEGDWFVTNQGLVFGTFSDENITDERPDRDQPLELAFDDGYMDPRALLLIQRSGTRVLVVAELYHSQHLGQTCIDELKELCKALRLPLPRRAYGSHEAVEFRQLLRRAGMALPRREAAPVEEGIKHLRSLVRDAQGVRTLLVHRRCTRLLYEIREGYQYPALGGDVPLDQDNHACDALRTWAWWRTRHEALRSARVDFFGKPEAHAKNAKHAKAARTRTSAEIETMLR